MPSPGRRPPASQGRRDPGVTSPFTDAGAAQISADGTTAYAVVALDKTDNEFTVDEAKALVNPVLAAADGASPTTTTASSATAQPDQTEIATRVIATVQEEVRGGMVFDLEDDTDKSTPVWSVKVAERTGRQFNLTVSADGSKVVSRTRDRTPDDDIRKLRSAKVPLEQATRPRRGTRRVKARCPHWK